MDDLVYYPFHFVGKKVILNTLGRIARSYELYAGKENFFTIPTVFPLEGSIEKIVLKWTDAPFAPIWNQIKRGDNGPNGQPAQCMTPGEFWDIQKYWPGTIAGFQYHAIQNRLR